MSRPAARAVLASLLALAAACSRPPKGMTRLDAGSSNHWFKIDHARRRLFYMQGGGSMATSLGVVDLENGRRRTYSFPHETIVALIPSGDGETVKVAAEGSGTGNKGELRYLLVDARTGGVAAQVKRDKIVGDELSLFGDRDRPDAPLPGAANAFAAPASTAPADDEITTFWYKIEGAPHPGVRTTLGSAGRRLTRFFPTATEPAQLASAPGATLYAAYDAGDGGWSVEELSATTGKRRPISRFPAEIESMAGLGFGLAVLRRAESGSSLRKLALVETTSPRVALELPWNDGESRFLAADLDKRLLYVQMHEGGNDSAWAVHFDETALRAASDYLARKRGSGVRKLTDEDVLGLALTGGMLVLLVLVLAMREA